MDDKKGLLKTAYSSIQYYICDKPSDGEVPNWDDLYIVKAMLSAAIERYEAAQAVK